ncbi:Transposase [Rhizobium tibeticum]|uniref:Transposase n=1 Tax=Rhizobium tibeticum TaxID=501024 RepID=A0A1H8W740_9HYPH|nr:IS110 family transposase [Rhizobium tibeticum]SEI20324.1 Transposase IS116/IS110/IS902 family protein [Rhizobium tibeticum]SEP23419.1 Transposase [Rhizobium tibeticum]
MSEVSIIGLDLAKNVFQAHGADASGVALFRKKLRRDQVLKFLDGQPACTVAMEACGSSHYWAREITKLGHDVRLIAPSYVKPFVKRQKNDAADAEAICEAAQRPTMRFVTAKSEKQQAAAMVFRARDLLVRQRTQTINAIRGHLAEFGLVAAQGLFHVAKLAIAIEDEGSAIPEAARPILFLLLEQLRSLDERVALLDREIARRAREDEDARRLMTIPGIGPVTATALSALAPSAPIFKRGRDFAAWLGLTPLQRSTGGKQKLGETSRMGERTLRRLLIIGASAAVRWAMRKGTTADPWLSRMLSRKPPMLVIVALANKTARIVWALMAKGGTYRPPGMAG